MSGGAQGHGHAPGKLILAGEHAVVFGHEAVAVAVDRRTEVWLQQRPGPRTVDATIDDARLHAALDTVLPVEGVGVRIETALPVGRGMGSSGALAVALLRARAALDGRTASFAELHRDGFAVERVFHGTPSGLDHAVSAHGGAVRYRRSAEGAVLLDPVPAPRWPLVVLDSGRAGDTGAMVAGVRSRRPAIDPILDAIGVVSAAVIAALQAGAGPDTLGPLLSENHRLLRAIGVSTPALDALVDLARRAGAAGAKLAGAGGGGVVIAACAEPEAVLAAAAAAGVSAWAAPVAPASV